MMPLAVLAEPAVSQARAGTTPETAIVLPGMIRPDRARVTIFFDITDWVGK